MHGKQVYLSKANLERVTTKEIQRYRLAIQASLVNSCFFLVFTGLNKHRQFSHCLHTLWAHSANTAQPEDFLCMENNQYAVSHFSCRISTTFLTHCPNEPLSVHLYCIFIMKDLNEDNCWSQL